MLGRKIARHGLAIVATALIGGFLSATLVRFAPGFDTDEAQLDPHLNSSSVQALRQARLEHNNIFRFYSLSLTRALRGDLGNSISLGQPVSTLLRDRAPLTLRLLGMGFLLSWAAVLALGAQCGKIRSRDLRRRCNRRQWYVALHPSCGFSFILRIVELARRLGHRAHHLSAGLPLYAQPAQ